MKPRKKTKNDASKKRTGASAGVLSFDNKSFFNKTLRSTPNWGCTPNIENFIQNEVKITTAETIHL